MSQPMIGEIRMFGGNFAPRSWALCQGQLLSISQNTALFSILGTIYGGDGRTTFGLPDLRGRYAIQEGTGPGLPTYRLGQQGGQPTTTLTTNNLPSHTHLVQGGGVSISTTDESATTNEASGNILAAGANIYRPGTGDPSEGLGGVAYTPPTAQNTGNQQAFNNMPPYLAVNYIIALQGIFPSRN